MSPAIVTSAPGWHGKLPALGDFASRRLDAEFIGVWDGWLATEMDQLKRSDEAGWLRAYLDSPSWRFLLMPGVLPGPVGATPWIGVLMPSVDRVGRYFPFTIAHRLDAWPSSESDFQTLSRWLHRLDDVAADALHDDWDVAMLETELSRLVIPEFTVDAKAYCTDVMTNGQIHELVLLPEQDVASVFSASAAGTWFVQSSGMAFWHAGNDFEHPVLSASRGLPTGQAFTSLLGRRQGYTTEASIRPSMPPDYQMANPAS